jgi:hypothetical protein
MSKITIGIIASLFISFSLFAEEDTLISHFECKTQGTKSFRPYYLQAVEGSTEYKDYSKTPKGLLGQNAMTTLEECQKALNAANNEFGAICSRTGLDGWKPTTYTGTVPGRADFGYLGGSSIMKFEDCLTSTRNSSKDGICFWGGSDWYVGPIDREGVKSGPYRSVNDCIQHTKSDD